MVKISDVFNSLDKKIIEIFFEDLVPEVKQVVLDFYHIKKPEEMNLDTFPICTLEMED